MFVFVPNHMQIQPNIVGNFKQSLRDTVVYFQREEGGLVSIISTLGTHPASGDTPSCRAARQKDLRLVGQQAHCSGAKMASSEFVRLWKDTPGAIDQGPGDGSLHKSIKSNDLELIFAREKPRGEKCISFETFLE